MTVLASIAVAITVALGIALRLVDPLSSPVIPAEDPFTHMALIRQHLDLGAFESLDEESRLYPPGMHALLAAVWAYTGVELYEVIRLGPVFLGAMGIIGMAALLWRHVGPVGGFVGGLGYAVAPEVIFRTTMMSPTALDLALTPFFLFALLEVAGGRMRWLPMAAVFPVYFIFAHPWLLGILSIAAFVLVVINLIAPGTGRDRPRAHALGLATVIALVGVPLGIAMTGCGGYCGPGLENFLPPFMQGVLFPALIIIASAAPALLLAAYPHSVDRFLPRGPRKALPWWTKLGISGLIAAAVVAMTLPALAQGLPEHVELPRMFGWPILIAAGLGFALVPFISNRLTYLGVGLALATYPMVIYNVFDSPYWPHRTAVFLGIGLAVLLGVAASGITKAVVEAAAFLQRSVLRRRSEASFSMLVVVPALIAVLSLGGTVYSATPDIYPDGWYRLYPECEMDAFQDIADEVEDGDLVVTGSWQARLVLVGLIGDGRSVWYDPPFFHDYDRREDTMAIQARDGGAVHVVLDRFMEEQGLTRQELGFLDEGVWVEHEAWCAGQGVAHPRVELYSTGGAPA